MTGGCKGFGKNIMRWPEDLIIGGVKREGAQLASAEALQSVFLVASPFDVFIRYKEPKPEVKPLLDTASWSPGKAEQVIVAWQRNFTVALYNHKANLEVSFPCLVDFPRSKEREYFILWLPLLLLTCWKSSLSSIT